MSIVLSMLSSIPGDIYQQDNACPQLRDFSNNVFKDMTYFVTLQVTRHLANRAHLGCGWKATAAVPEYRYRSLSWHYFPRLRPIQQLSSDFSQFGLAIHQNDHQARRRFVMGPKRLPLRFSKRILFSDEVHFWLNGYVNKQNCRIWSEADSVCSQKN
ncbi:hypothetical protein TNCV_1056551 [Trichonephila clavipes]|nr:hypothetical protein TNCV_1056551 [Trichonephila clavipes]